jgi:hypothetical protein
MAGPPPKSTQGLTRAVGGGQVRAAAGHRGAVPRHRGRLGALLLRRLYRRLGVAGSAADGQCLSVRAHSAQRGGRWAQLRPRPAAGSTPPSSTDALRPAPTRSTSARTPPSTSTKTITPTTTRVRPRVVGLGRASLSTAFEARSSLRRVVRVFERSRTNALAPRAKKGSSRRTCGGR